MPAFDNPVEYENWYRAHPLIYASEADAIKELKLRNCVDVGSGPSAFHEVLSGETISVDASLEMLKYASEQEDKVQADACHLPFRSGSLDCVCSIAAIMFFPDLRTFLGEAHRALKTGGVLGVCFIPLDSEWGALYAEAAKRGDKYFATAKLFTKEEVLNEVAKLFRVEEVVSTLAHGASEEVHEKPARGALGSFVCVKARKKRGNRIFTQKSREVSYITKRQ